MSRRRSSSRLLGGTAEWTPGDAFPSVPWFFAEPMPEPWEEYLWHQWLSAWADVLLGVCENVWLKQGARLYDSHRDHALREDLKDWLWVKAVESAADFMPDPTHPNPHLQFAKFLTEGLDLRARRHFSSVVGSEQRGPASAAALRAHQAGIRSTDALDDIEATEGIRVARHPLHGDNLLNLDPASILVRLEELHAKEQMLRRWFRDRGWFTVSPSSESMPCLESNCSKPAHARGLCMSHARRDQRLWGAERGYGCNVPGCPDGHQSRGLCGKHYAQYIRGRNEALEQYVEKERRKPLKQAPKVCIEEGCERKMHAQRLCSKHYRQRKLATAEPCIIEDCEKPQYVRKMCTTHYQRWQRAQKQGDR